MKWIVTRWLLALGLLWCAGTAQAQIELTAPPDTVSPWRTKLKASLNISEALLSDNWKGGGVSFLGLNGLLNTQANYRLGRNSWDNQADVLFAFAHNKGQGYRKNLDRLFLDTKYGYSISSDWDMFASLNLLTQFAPGYEYKKDSAGTERARFVSSWFAPAFITSSYGFEYHPATFFKLRLSPFSPRITVVNDPRRFVATVGDSPYGVRPPRQVRYEILALQVLSEFDKEIMQNVTLKGRYLLFANYEKLNWRKIDHRLELAITAKVNRYINVAVTGIGLYDYDQDTKIQASQTLSLGFLYTFQNYTEQK
ncbi:DUF3078 domain-containing protein [Hymenobacter oligotrophus]|uniref:DUF3078 domain-containing protein n=1 Tax=Hymenobacter oligotrophus TaxID=2319843 RepID=A0A3B7QY54_9BACT|nr:DUF3078 domain-containing protein [Hymenobacter oligotrophus]AYA36744.1 DUF3078 domain-containing protein [Hymenobacter oligotrophus]